VGRETDPVPEPTPAPQGVEHPRRTGSGRFEVAPLSRSAVPVRAGTTYRVEIERELPFDLEMTAAFVESTLDHPRGWNSVTDHTFTAVITAPEIRILIATPATTDRLCAPFDTAGELSCRNGPLVVINAQRWATGAPAYATRLTAYRRYVINHEVGHAIGFPHASCPAAGEPAPVMLQQTKGLQGCTANPWPA